MGETRAGDMLIFRIHDGEQSPRKRIDVEVADLLIIALQMNPCHRQQLAHCR